VQFFLSFLPAFRRLCLCEGPSAAKLIGVAWVGVYVVGGLAPQVVCPQHVIGGVRLGGVVQVVEGLTVGHAARRVQP